MVPARNGPTARAEVPAVHLARVAVTRGRTTALEGVDLRIESGERVVLIGPNGSGKTTLLHVVAGLLSPTEGTVRVLGARPAARRAEIAYVLQGARIGRGLPITVEEVVRMGRHPRRGLLGRMSATDRRAAWEALECLDVVDLRHRHLRELSGGQRQRVMVAQALAQQADVLLLDEPLTGLDLPSRRIIDAVLDDERDRGATVLLSTHDLADTISADQVVLLAGRVVAAGPREEVLVADRLTEAYCGRLIALRDGSVLLDDGAHR